jgi:hypothetical protein
MSTRKNQDQFNPNELQVTASVPYAKNIFAMFINTNISIHSVTPRTPGPFRSTPVRVCLTGTRAQQTRDLLSLTPQQTRNSPSVRPARYAQQVPTKRTVSSRAARLSGEG